MREITRVRDLLYEDFIGDNRRPVELIYEGIHIDSEATQNGHQSQESNGSLWISIVMNQRAREREKDYSKLPLYHEIIMNLPI